MYIYLHVKFLFYIFEILIPFNIIEIVLLVLICFGFFIQRMEGERFILIFTGLVSAVLAKKLQYFSSKSYRQMFQTRVIAFCYAKWGRFLQPMCQNNLYPNLKTDTFASLHGIRGSRVRSLP